jgi:hypothetical protein
MDITLKYIFLERLNKEMSKILTIIGALMAGGISIAVMNLQSVQAALTQN